MKKCWKSLRPPNNGAIIWWLAAILWMLFIFFLSSQPAQVSNDLSKKITGLFINIISIDLVSNNNMREYAHIVEYIILVILVINVLRSMGMSILKSCLLAILISVTFAGLDEFHQMFVPGRGVQLRDFLIDCAGVLLGLAVHNIGAFLYKKLNFS